MSLAIRIITPLLAVVALLGLAGCRDPYASRMATESAPSAQQRALSHAQTTGEYPSSRPTTPTTPGDTRALGTTPKEALSRFGELYINWTARTVADHLHYLARRSVGNVSEDLSRSAQESRSDYELHRGGVYNRGTIEAITPKAGQPHAYIIVTRETTGATSGDYQGLRPAYHVTLARLQRVTGGWTVSEWQPQN